MISFQINGKQYTTEAPADTPLLWVLRDHLDLTGTKYGCGQGLCGSCTVHLGKEAIRSCVTPVGDVQGESITTIEGLAANEDYPVIRAWIEEDVPQCGYCQPGQIMQAAALLANNARPEAAEIDGIMSTVLCRCGTYLRIRRAIERAIREGGER